MRIPKTHIVILFALLLGTAASGQSDLLFSNYNINAVAFNPAAIENNSSMNAYMGMRQQWIGWEDAPNMQWLHASTFFDKANMGISLNINNQDVGAELTQNIKLGYSYKLYLNGGHQLNFGLAAGIYFRKLDFSKLRFEEDQQNIPLSDERQAYADFDFGFEYNYNGLTVGISSNHITVNNKKATIFKIPIQNHIYAKYTVEAGGNIKFIPGLAYHRNGTLDMIDVSADMQFKDIFSTGFLYRLSTSFVIRAGVRLSNVFELNYAYDLGAGKFRNYNWNS
ncbi:MAG: type IX secretion system membrane protein PorP/SprF [Chlorobi bacterium]|nr:type IX secretion system membrane protein PorP/SprF [Chlorobiota bacterium]